MISVVMPLYNKERYVEKAITSVLSQTYQDFQCIIVNDGSTDGSLKIVEGFKDRRITIISKNNQGASAARNFGIESASNEYIALLDADDWWAPTYLEEILKAMTKFPQNKIYTTGRIHVFMDKEVEYKNAYLPNKENIGKVNYFKVISKYLPAVHASAIVFQKDHFTQKGGFNEAMQHFEDHECWLRIAVDQPIVFVNKLLSFYNKTAQDSMSQAAVRSSDLAQYFETVITVKKQLSRKEARYFRKFYQRFAKWSYLKYAPVYTEKERLLLQESLHQLVSSLEVKILDALQSVGIAAIYQRAKKPRSSGR